MSGMSKAVSEAVAQELAGKKWYTSKTVWANVLAAGALGAQMKYGFIIGPEWQTLLLSGLNLVLRKITKEEIVW